MVTSLFSSPFFRRGCSGCTSHPRCLTVTSINRATLSLSLLAAATDGDEDVEPIACVGARNSSRRQDTSSSYTHLRMLYRITSSAVSLKRRERERAASKSGHPMTAACCCGFGSATAPNSEGNNISDGCRPDRSLRNGQPSASIVSRCDEHDCINVRKARTSVRWS